MMAQEPPFDNDPGTEGYDFVQEAWERNRGKHVNGVGGAADLIDPTTWQNKPVPHREWLVENMVPMFNVTQFSGDGGLGKSQIALQLMVACALDFKWLGFDVSSGPAFGLFCEDDQEELHRRLASILDYHDAQFSDLKRMRMLSRVGLDNALMTFDGGFGAGEETVFAGTVLNTITNMNAKVVVLDSLHDLFGGNENSRLQARQFVGMLRNWAMESGGAVVLTAHPSLTGRNSGTGEAGSTAWHNAVRSRLYLTRPEDSAGDERLLDNKKANYGAQGDPIELMWRDGVFVRRQDDDVGIFGSIRKNRAEGIFLDCLDTLTDQGRYVTHATNSPNCAAKVMLSMDKTNGLKMRDLNKAMENLLARKEIKIVQNGPPSARRQKIVRS